MTDTKISENADSRAWQWQGGLRASSGTKIRAGRSSRSRSSRPAPDTDKDGNDFILTAVMSGKDQKALEQAHDLYLGIALRRH